MLSESVVILYENIAIYMKTYLDTQELYDRKPAEQKLLDDFNYLRKDI